jgi:transposase
MILDNYGTHKHANVKKWLAKHPRFHLHFIPTSSSWLNLVERWFRDLTDKAIRRKCSTVLTNSSPISRTICGSTMTTRNNF